MDKNTLYPILIKNFLRVCRENKFHYTLKKKWISEFMGKNVASKYSFFKEANILNYVLAKADVTITDMLQKQRRDGSDYEQVMIATNSLLHLFIEGQGYCNGDKVPQLGEEIFNRTCYQLYGDKFLEDMKKFKKENPSYKRKQDTIFLKNVLDELVNKYHINLNRIVEENKVNGLIQWESLNEALITLYNELSRDTTNDNESTPLDYLDEDDFGFEVDDDEF